MICDKCLEESCAGCIVEIRHDLEDQPPVPGGTTAIRDGQYVTEDRAPGPRLGGPTMTEPTTEAGRALLADADDLPLELLGVRILAIEDEARRAPAREVVDCDDDCGAFQDPATCDEYKAAWEHWQSHYCLAGCSHAR